ncbi:MAG: hypothetical protein WC939_01395 [Acholeplasmataceae bacterium]
MLTKSTLQKIKNAYAIKRGSVLFDNENLKRLSIATLILTDIYFHRAVVITLAAMNDRLKVHSIKGEIMLYQIAEIQRIIDENE